ncbi:MAG TPA: hypothetical protein VGE34_02685 [Candidatus Saccharimonadales bacterium]
MSSIEKFDHAFINFSKKNYPWIARIALFVIFFLFGFLKLIGASPATDLALGFATKMGAGSYGHELFIALACIECLIGLMILLPKLTRPAIFIMLLHMLLVSAPLVLYPEATWSAPFVPNLEGQYIIKNIALVALALGLVAATPPLKKK